MKLSIFITVCCAMFALSGAARAQDSTPVPEPNSDGGSAVDASVHAGVEEQSAQQPHSSVQPSNKRQQTSYSQRAFQSANQTSATRFQPSRAPSLPAEPGETNNPSTLFNPLTRSEAPPEFLRRSLGLGTSLGISPLAGSTDRRDAELAALRDLLRSPNSESGTPAQGFGSKRPMPSLSPRNDGFSPSLREWKPETDRASFPSPFSKPAGWSSNSLRAKSLKHSPPRSADRSKPISLFDSQPAKQN
jgi:hypothetical protein